MHAKLLLLCLTLLATAWTVAHQAPLSMEFSRHEHWSGLPFPPPGDLLHPGILPLLNWQVGSLPLATPGKPLGDMLCDYNYRLSPISHNINIYNSI